MTAQPELRPVREALRRGTLKQAPERRQSLAEQIADRMDLPMAGLGIVFVLLGIAEGLSDPTGALDDAFAAATIALAAIFIGEFVLRVVVAPSTKDYLGANWWQIVFLVLTVLRLARVLGRVARVGRVASSAVRATRSAASALTSRMAWLATITAIVILSAG